MDELKKNEQAIKDLLNVLENRRYETLQLTFKQVAKNFHEVFKQLIPQGRADLIMKTSDAGQVCALIYVLSEYEVYWELLIRVTD